MPPIEWEVIDPADEARFTGNYGPLCPGLHLNKGAETNRWILRVEEGRVSMTSGCADCDAVVWDPVGGEDIEMYDGIVGHLESHVEIMGYETPEYDHWWVFVPEVIERAD